MEDAHFDVSVELCLVRISRLRDSLDDESSLVTIGKRPEGTELLLESKTFLVLLMYLKLVTKDVGQHRQIISFLIEFQLEMRSPGLSLTSI